MRFIILYAFVSGVGWIVDCCWHWLCYNVNAFIFLHMQSIWKEKHDHIIRRVSNHCNFGLKFLFMTTSGAITAWIKHTINVWRFHNRNFLSLYLWAVMLSFEWPIDMLYVDIDAGAGGRDLSLEFVMHFSYELFFSSSVHCRCWHHIAVCNLLFFLLSSNGAPAELSWYHVNLKFNIWLMWPMPETKKSLDKVIFIIVQMDQMDDAAW